MSTVTVLSETGVDYAAWVTAVKSLNAFTVAFTPIVDRPAAPLGDDTITLALSGNRTVTVFGEFSGTTALSGAGPIYKVEFRTNGKLDLRAAWDDGHRFDITQLIGAFAAGGSAVEALLTQDPILFKGNKGSDLMFGGGAADTFNGGAGADNLSTGAGNDRLNGGAGLDTLTGGDGDDTYVNPFTPGNGLVDVIVEAANGGIDTIESNATLSLAAFLNVENLTLTGTANINGTGDDGDNVITGNGGANNLNGGGGNDTLIGGGGADRLSGGAGANVLRGGNGNDIYVNPVLGPGADTIIEGSSAESGIDLVQSNASISLAGTANVEQILLLGTGNIDATGNTSANTITGNSGRNVLDGGSGSDTLFGGEGKDVLIGGPGNDVMDGGGAADTFRFASTNTGTDTINGFSTALDRFDLNGGTFTNVAEADGNTTLTHAGGKIVIVGVTGLTPLQWNALVLPAGGAAAAAPHPIWSSTDTSGGHALASSVHLAAYGFQHLDTAGHGDFLLA